MGYGVFNHEACQKGKDDDERIEHGNVTGFIEIVLSEQCQVDGEEDDYDQNVERLAE